MLPLPPGIISKSSSGQLSIVTSGVKRRPPTAKTGPIFSETKSILKGDDDSCRHSSFKRVTENTSKGPATSKISTYQRLEFQLSVGEVGFDCFS